MLLIWSCNTSLSDDSFSMCFGQYNETFGATSFIYTAKHGDPAIPNPIDFADGLFKFMRINIASGTNDNVLDSTGDIKLAIGDITQITGVQPVTIEQCSGFFGITKITTGGDGPRNRSCLHGVPAAHAPPYR